MGEWVRRTGSFSLACTAHSRASALPARAPRAHDLARMPPGRPSVAGPRRGRAGCVTRVVVGEGGHLVGHGVGGHGGTTMPGYRGGVTPKARVRRELLRVPGAMPVARLTVETIRVCLRYRVTGLASEAGFFMLLSLPPLVLGLFGGVGYVGGWLGQRHRRPTSSTGSRRSRRTFLVAGRRQRDHPADRQRRAPERPRSTSSRVGFLLSIWSGSRALNVFVDTISIMYGQSGVRGIVRTRALSLTLYFLSLVVGHRRRSRWSSSARPGCGTCCPRRSTSWRSSTGRW